MDQESKKFRITDVSECQKTGLELRLSQERMKLALEAANAGVWEWNLTDNSNIWSENLWRLYGLHPAQTEPSFDVWRATVHPDDREHVVSEVMMAAAAGKELSIEWRTSAPPGQERWLSSRGQPFRDESGQVVCYLGVVIDITERKQADAALRQSEERFRTLVEQAPEAIFIQTRRRFAYVNAATVRFFGATSPEQLLGELVEDLIHPDYRDLALERIRQLNEQRLPQPSADMVFIRLDGSHCAASTSGVPFEFDGASGALVFVRDITERKQNEQALIKMQSLLAESQKIAHLGSFEYLADTQETIWSEEEYRIYGLDPAGPSPEYHDMLNRCIHPDDAAMLDQTFAAALQTGTVYELEHRIIRPDGTVHWVHDRAHPYFSDTGKLVRYVGTTLDITERKAAEDRLRKLNLSLERQVAERTVALSEALEQTRRSEERYRSVVQDQTEIIARCLPDTTLTFVNEVYCRFTGKTSGELLGARWLPERLDEEQEFIEAELGRLSPETPVVTIENRVRDAEGRNRWMQFVNRGFFDDAGRLREIQAVGRDITERKQHEDELESARRAAEAANKAKSDFLAVMSHELRTPLAAILGYAETLNEGLLGTLSPKQQCVVSRIGSSGEHLLSLINDILDLAKIEAGKMETTIDVCSIDSVCLGALQLVRFLAMQKQITLSDSLVGAPRSIMTDARMLKQILINLLTNAVKFTPDGGQVRLDLATDRDRGEISFIVGDSGIGISPEDQTRLFTPFTQLDSSMNRQHEGTGLGLDLCRKLALLLGGRIELQSALGQGSIFTLTLPLREAGDRPSAQPPA